MILVKEKFDCDIEELQEDEQGKFIILKGYPGYRFLFVNIYSPNKTKDQCIFFEEIQKQLDKLELEDTCELTCI